MQAINLPPVKADSFTLDSNLPYVLVFLAFRMPGTSSPDFAASRILGDVIASQRAELYDLVPQGKALGTEFGLAETYPKASVGYALAAIPAGADPAPITAAVRKILAGYAEKGVSAELVAAAKKSEVANNTFEQNSIPGSLGRKLVGSNRRRRPHFALGDCRCDEQGNSGRCQSRSEKIPHRR